MKFLKYMKDGGPESKVAGFFFTEIKSLFSVVLLYFFDGSREAYHDHAFNALSWVFKGKLTESVLSTNNTYGGMSRVVYTPSLIPIWTSRKRMHKVVSTGNTWVLPFRGPWVDKWHEFLPNTQQNITLTHDRKVLSNGN
jgi:hypothetical protein